MLILINLSEEGPPEKRTMILASGKSTHRRLRPTPGCTCLARNPRHSSKYLPSKSSFLYNSRKNDQSHNKVYLTVREMISSFNYHVYQKTDSKWQTLNETED